MKGFCPLASGSKGNAIYVGSGKTKILIDAGISATQIEKRLATIGVSLDEIDAVIVTHEHTDHIQGIAGIAARGIPVFANSDTAKALMTTLKKRPRFKIFSTGETFEFGDLEIHPFTIQHDTLDPVGFTIQVEGVKLGICADIGFVTTLVTNRLQGCDYLYVEANHQPSMVHSSSRPMVYKQRVLSRQGHLSNEECAELLCHIAHKGLKHVYLAHLSQECNSEDLALKIISEKLAVHGIPLNISIAYQERVSLFLDFEESLKGDCHEPCVPVL